MELKFKHFVFLQAMDVISTFLGLTYLGLREANTFALGIFQEYGLLNGLIALKVGGLVIIYLVLYIKPLKFKIKEYYINITPACMKIGCFMFMFVVANNLYRIYEVI